MATIKPPSQNTKTELVTRYCASETNHKNCTLYKLLDNHYERKYSLREEVIQ